MNRIDLVILGQLVWGAIMAEIVIRREERDARRIDALEAEIRRLKEQA